MTGPTNAQVVALVLTDVLGRLPTEHEIAVVGTVLAVLGVDSDAVWVDPDSPPPGYGVDVPSSSS